MLEIVCAAFLNDVLNCEVRTSRIIKLKKLTKNKQRMLFGDNSFEKQFSGQAQDVSETANTAHLEVRVTAVKNDRGEEQGRRNGKATHPWDGTTAEITG